MKKYMCVFSTSIHSLQYAIPSDIRNYKKSYIFKINYENIRPKVYGIFLYTQYHGGSFTDKQAKRKEGQVKFSNIFVKTW